MAARRRRQKRSFRIQNRLGGQVLVRQVPKTKLPLEPFDHATVGPSKQPDISILAHIVIRFEAVRGRPDALPLDFLPSLVPLTRGRILRLTFDERPLFLDPAERRIKPFCRGPEIFRLVVWTFLQRPAIDPAVDGEIHSLAPGQPISPVPHREIGKTVHFGAVRLVQPVALVLVEILEVLVPFRPSQAVGSTALLRPLLRGGPAQFPLYF